MREKEILKQLNKFQGIKPDSDWKKNNRDLLLSQISNSQAKNVEFNWLANLKIGFQALNSTYQPAMAVVLIALFIVSGGTFGLKASQDTKPGDSLYIAKRISEKTQLAFTFSEEKKKQLGIEFMGNRMEELSQVLASADAGSKKVEVAKTINDLKQELNNVKNLGIVNNAIEKEEVDDAEGMVFTANSNKEERGIQISDSPIVFEREATSTEELVIKPEEILKQAKELLEQEDYDAVISKLEEAGNAITDNDGEVKGVEEMASSTEE